MDRVVSAAPLSKPEPAFQSSADKGLVPLQAGSKGTLGSSAPVAHAFLQALAFCGHTFILQCPPPPPYPLMLPMMDAEAGAAECICEAQRIRAAFLIQRLYMQAVGSAAQLGLCWGWKLRLTQRTSGLCFTSARAGAGIHGGGASKYKSLLLNSHWEGTLQFCFTPFRLDNLCSVDLITFGG